MRNIPPIKIFRKMPPFLWLTLMFVFLVNSSENCSSKNSIVGSCTGLNQRAEIKRKFYQNFGCPLNKNPVKRNQTIECLDCFEVEFQSLNVKIEHCPFNDYKGFHGCYQSKDPFKFMCPINMECKKGECVDLKCYRGWKDFNSESLLFNFHKREIQIGLKMNCSIALYTSVLLIIFIVNMLINLL
jgi:hypothetical protein